MMESLPIPVTEAQTTETETTVTTSTSPAESTVQTLSQEQSSEQGEGALSEDIANQLGKVSLSKQKLTAKERREKIKQACEAKGIKYDPNFKRKQKLEKKKAENSIQTRNLNRSDGNKRQRSEDSNPTPEKQKKKPRRQMDKPPTSKESTQSKLDFAEATTSYPPTDQESEQRKVDLQTEAWRILNVNPLQDEAERSQSRLTIVQN
ncbi:hypothetical protein FQR65_LT12265 [Abscondita terminalis]|nr:hypothetical protein FQR65_LT12265 [Abscondita terminalis]